MVVVQSIVVVRYGVVTHLWKVVVVMLMVVVVVRILIFVGVQWMVSWLSAISSHHHAGDSGVVVDSTDSPDRGPK